MTQIRRARGDELEALRDIDRDAGRAFAGIGMPEIAADEPPSPTALESFVEVGHAWVAVDASDHPVGYLVSDIVDGCAHIEQISVAPAHARRGVGAALIHHLDAHAAAEHRPALTLTTFRDVPWNAPYYARLGFVVLGLAEQGPELRAYRARDHFDPRQCGPSRDATADPPEWSQGARSVSWNTRELASTIESSAAPTPRRTPSR